MLRYTTSLASSVILAASAMMFLGCEPNRDLMDTNVAPTNTDTIVNQSVNDAATLVGVCNLEPIGGSGVTGTIRFTQRGDSVQIEGKVAGLTPGKHGFHVHAKGDLSDKEKGKSAGDHFNPDNKDHGRPSDGERHVGDLGNIEAGEDGLANFTISDKVIKFSGPNSIVGKALVIHSGADQFTQPAGDAGDRVAFGLIEKQ